MEINSSKAKLNVPVLDGFRVVFIFLVANFHIWQQSWLPQYLLIFDHYINFDYITRTGYVFVDGMILISAFLLYLPYINKTEVSLNKAELGEFYVKKIARIIPSYLFNILILFFFVALPYNRYSNMGKAIWDLFAHIFCVQTFSFNTYVATPLNAGLWTVVILLQGYVLMPFVIKRFIKKPILLFSIMTALSWIYRAIVYFYVKETSVFINQLPAFLDVYALGFMGAMLYNKLENINEEFKHKLKFIFFALMILSIFSILHLLKYQAAQIGFEALRNGQLAIRFPLTLAMIIAIISAQFSYKWFVWILSNKLLKHLALISYNFYIWHQVLSSNMRLSFYDTETLHNTYNMQEGFTLLCYSVAMVVATFATIYVEKPSSKIILKAFDKYKIRRKTNEGSKRTEIS